MDSPSRPKEAVEPFERGIRKGGGGRRRGKREGGIRKKKYQRALFCSFLYLLFLLSKKGDQNILPFPCLPLLPLFQHNIIEEKREEEK